MASKTTVDALNAGVGQLDISGRRSPAYMMDGNDVIFMPKTMTRHYIMSRQPWDSTFLPQQYIPDGKLRWFPPLFFLGVPFTTEEVCHFARRLDLPLRGDGDYNTYYLVARHLSKICGFTGPDSVYPLHRITVEECDAAGRSWMLALISNYQIPRGLDYSDPYEIMFEAVEKVFGESKRIEWWLEHPLNHTPKDLMWLKLKPEWIRDWDREYGYND